MFLSTAASSRSTTASRANGFVMRSPQRLLPIFVLTLSSLALLHIEAFAQDKPLTDDDVIHVDTNLVTVPTIVTDSHGQRIPDLNITDFALREDGRPIKLEYFSAGAERIALVFALDISGSVRETIAQQRRAALALFSHFKQGSRVAVLHFGETANLALPLTTETDLAPAAFTLTLPASRRTAIFDATATALRAFPIAGSDPAERRIVVLISDGLDTASTTTANEVINAATLRNVSIYIIHLPLYAPRDGHLAPRPTAKGFRELATRTGGRYFMAGNAKLALDPHAQFDLAPLFKAIEEDLRSQYMLGYYPADATHDDSFHKIEITLTQRNARNFRVKALREGYTLKQ